MHKTTHVYPILGVRSIDQLNENISALDVHLTPQHLEFIDSVLPFSLGAPHDVIVRAHCLHSMSSVLLTPDSTQGVGTAPSASIRAAIVLDWDPVPQPIRLP